MPPNKQAEALKDQGNQFFKTGKYAEAIAKYREATQVDPSQPAYWSNMAACYEKLNKFEEMAEAGRSCIKADRNFVKGYFRLATAYKQLNDLPNCIKTLESGLAVEANNPDLKKMKKEITELQRQAQVLAYCDKVDEYIQNGDIVNASKTLELASRLDAGNPRLELLRKKIQPKFEQLEAKRKANLSATELHKERGDEAYKNAQFEKAIEHYTKCIDLLIAQGQGLSELAAKAYSNRAACYKQISHFDGTIADCTSVLEIKPDDVKALIRRAQAFEGVERYRFALQDVKTVLSMDPKVVGKQNWDLCNGMQHRLNRTVTQLKKMNTA
jgi:stress-induced-phosphoprotein 1